jgi:hypothetical protein
MDIHHEKKGELIREVQKLRERINSLNDIK